MRTGDLIFTLGFCLLRYARAQECTNIGLLESIGDCVLAIPTYTLSYTDSAAAFSWGCTYEQAVLGCYSSFCPGATPDGVSQALLLSSEFCNGAAPSSIYSVLTAAAATDTGDVSTTAPVAGSEPSPSGASPTTTASIHSQTSQAAAPKAHTLLVQKFAVVGMAGLVGGMMV